MNGISDFVRGTLAYFANCCIALIPLTGSSFRFKPIEGALRCKVRADLSVSEVPDSRVILFIASCLFGTICTYSLHGFAAVIAALAQAAIGESALPKNAMVTSVLFYFVCERAIAQATTRTITPGRRGRRNRQILRFLIASLLIQISVYEPIALIVLGKLSNFSWFKLAEKPDTAFGGIVNAAWEIAHLAVLLVPFLYLGAVLERSKSLMRSDAGFSGLGSLPVNLIGASLAGALLTSFLYPQTAPKLVTLECRATIGVSADTVAVDALFRNDSDQYWTPGPHFKINILGDPESNPFTNEISRFRTYSEGWAPQLPGEEPERPVIAPHQEFRFRRHVKFPKGYIDPQFDNGCSLSTERPPIRLFDVFRRGLPEEKIQWIAIEPADFKAGDMYFETENSAENLTGKDPDNTTGNDGSKKDRREH